MTAPTNWTSTFANRFRDTQKFISPHPGQPMYHYKGAYDPSHYADRRFDPNIGMGISGEETQRARSLDLRGSSGLGYGASASSVGVVDGEEVLSGGRYGLGFSKRNLWRENMAPLTGAYTDSYAPAPPSNGAYKDPYVDGTGYWRQPASGYGMAQSAPQGAPQPSVLRDTPRNKYHIPGYAGFVRGMQFRYSDTYGKVTRRCLDIPVDVPIQPAAHN
eukprot:CAMPEP_0205833256 /NCGR_PEP_ID=MMETSP0206-20130828/49219_1 /ASSEMBLY_ACC=CAM_ASM_000279 /TAXON_ID=36767 /ORGANISM="Euplotes focardii, Strain TN1" /LENGTH=216 /DNA_ID=CAMNT_0053139495 /DNA_START=30 /DNA_END=680 /DNA_ORIENTATION=+